MTTATGEFAINYAGESNAAPYTNASMAYPTGSGTGQVLSGVFRYNAGATTVVHRYTGSMGSGEIRSKIELGTIGTGGDESGAAIIDTNGDGYAVKLQSSTALVIVRLDNFATADFLDSATVSACATGDVVELRRSAAGQFTVWRNGTQLTDLDVTDTTVTAGLSAGPMIVADNVGNSTIVSWAIDGIAASARTPGLCLLGVG